MPQLRARKVVAVVAYLLASLGCRSPDRALPSSGLAPSHPPPTVAPAPAETASPDEPPPAPPPANPTGAPHPSSLLRPGLEACVARVPKAPSFRVIDSFAPVQRELVVAWQLAEGPELSTGSAAPSAVPSTIVRLSLMGGGVTWTEPLGTHAGQPYSADLSYCQSKPVGQSPCVHARHRLTPGLVSDVSVQSWYGYLHMHTARWLLVRRGAAIIVVTSETRDALLELDEQGARCSPDAWRQQMEIRVDPSVYVRERVLVGPKEEPFDCAKSDKGDSRCAG